MIVFDILYDSFFKKIKKIIFFEKINENNSYLRELTSTS